jgi:hypothetical protein
MNKIYTISELTHLKEQHEAGKPIEELLPFRCRKTDKVVCLNLGNIAVSTIHMADQPLELMFFVNGKGAAVPGINCLVGGEPYRGEMYASEPDFFDLLIQVAQHPLNRQGYSLTSRNAPSVLRPN